jgi:hypothetical protein
MLRKDHERWQELCELVVVVEDPKMFADFATEIKRLLDAEQERLDAKDSVK